MKKRSFALGMLCGGLASITVAAAAQPPLPQTPTYSQKTLLKNWALSACLARVAQDERTAADANAAAGGYLEFGRQGLEVYEEIGTLVARYASLKYAGSVPSEFNTMKCIDLFHSKELERLVARAVRVR
jgi:hypothetical protein